MQCTRNTVFQRAAPCLHLTNEPCGVARVLGKPAGARTCLSTLVFCRQVTLAEPMSPLVENLMPSFVTPMTTVSPMVVSSPTMRLNSCAGIRTLQGCTRGVESSLYDVFHMIASQLRPALFRDAGHKGCDDAMIIAIL